MTRTERMHLYKACKYQVEENQADCGFTLPRMWDVVNGRTQYDGNYWKETCLYDYDNRVDNFTDPVSFK